MQDRVPLFPGRVQLVPVAGQENIYDMTRADQPTQAGTPLSKASLLTDATAALYGLGTEAVPDDVLAAIKTLLDSVDSNAESKAKIQTGSYVGTGVYGSSNRTSLTFSGKPIFFMIQAYSKTIISGTTYETFEWGKWSIVYRPSNNGMAQYGNSGYGLGGVSWSDNGLSWQSNNNASEQYNSSGATYYYLVGF